MSDIEIALQQACEAVGTTVDAMRSGEKRAEIAETRWEVMHRLSADYSRAAIAEVLHCTQSAVGRGIAAITERIATGHVKPGPKARPLLARLNAMRKRLDAANAEIHRLQLQLDACDVQLAVLIDDAKIEAAAMRKAEQAREREAIRQAAEFRAESAARLRKLGRWEFTAAKPVRATEAA